MPRGPKDPNAPKKTREKKKQTLQFFLEGDTPGTLGDAVKDVDEAIEESVRKGFKNIAAVEWLKPVINKRKIDLVPVPE